MFNLIVGELIGQMSANRGPVSSLINETNQTCSIRHASLELQAKSSLVLQRLYSPQLFDVKY